MFDKDFFPTPEHVIDVMLSAHDITGKIILEPSAGKGNLVDRLKKEAKEVIACEKNDDLRKIVSSKCKVIGSDFLKLTSDKISHVDFIIMNPPFSQAVHHIKHAWEIAPEGCIIISLCNSEILRNRWSNSRELIAGIIETYGHSEDLGNCFSDSERKTDVEVSLIVLTKPGCKENEFEGFFLEEDPEETQYNGLMPYNFVRDLVQRYIGAMRIYDEQLDAAIRMNDLTSSFFSSNLSLSMTEDDKPRNRMDFKKDLQKAGWNFVFSKMNMNKHATKGLREDINKFVETQEKFPFTMRNIYKMLEIAIGTTESRMDKAILEVFDKLTQTYHENRFNVEGWKTNSHYLMGKKFIIPYICYQDQRWYKGSSRIELSGRNESIEDFLKALCYISGDNYDDFISLYSFCRYEYKIYDFDKKKYIHADNSLVAVENKVDALRLKGKNVQVKHYAPAYGELFEWSYFKCRAYKKGTMHFTFKDDKLWAMINQRVAKIKGYPLPEAIKL